MTLVSPAIAAERLATAPPALEIEAAPTDPFGSLELPRADVPVTAWGIRQAHLCLLAHYQVPADPKQRPADTRAIGAQLDKALAIALDPARWAIHDDHVVIIGSHGDPYRVTPAFCAGSTWTAKGGRTSTICKGMARAKVGMCTHFACGGDLTLRDLDVALACGQRDLLVSAGTPAVRHLRRLPGVSVVLDSAAWPPNNPARPSFDTWWQALRAWRDGPADYGNLTCAIAYDTIGHAAQTQRDYTCLMGRVFDRAGDLPVVPVLGFGGPPAAISLDILQGWAGARPDLVDGSADRPAYALGGLVPQRGSRAAVAWVQAVADALADLVDAEGIDPDALGVHVLGSTRRAYLDPLLELGIPVSCDTSTPIHQALTGPAALAWGYTERYGLPHDLLLRSRYARVAFWLCRERDRLGLPWQTPDPSWLEELPGLTPTVIRSKQLPMRLAA